MEAETVSEMSVLFHIRMVDQPTVFLCPQYSTAPPDGGEWSVSIPLLYPTGKSLQFTAQNNARVPQPV